MFSCLFSLLKVCTQFGIADLAVVSSGWVLCQTVAGSSFLHAKTEAVLLVALFVDLKKNQWKLFSYFSVNRREETKLLQEKRIKLAFVYLVCWVGF